MNLIASLNALDRRYGWSLLGFVLAAIFGAITLYTEFVRDTRPELRFELVSDTSVLDVREPLGDLAIMYGGADIRKARQALRVLLVRVRNAGVQDILRGHYDDRTPVGFKIVNGSLLRAQLLSATNQYITDTLRIDIRDGQSAFLTPVILESQEGFVLKCLVLSSEDSRAQVEPFGKVAGVRRIALIDSTQAASQASFWVTAFAGSLWVQLARLIVHFVGLILTVAAVVMPIAGITEIVSKRRRRRHVRRFRAVEGQGLEPPDDFIFDSYIRDGLGFLQYLQFVAADEQRLNRQADRESSEVTGVAPHLEVESSGQVDVRFGRDPYRGIDHRFMWRVPVREMEAAGFVRQENSRWVPDAHVKSTLERFLGFLKRQGLDEKRPNSALQPTSRAQPPGKRKRGGRAARG